MADCYICGSPVATNLDGTFALACSICADTIVPLQQRVMEQARESVRGPTFISRPMQVVTSAEEMERIIADFDAWIAHCNQSSRDADGLSRDDGSGR